MKTKFKKRSFLSTTLCRMRWLNKFKSIGTLPASRVFDNGFTIRASAMVVDKLLQLYAVGSYVNGQYGKPWEINTGVNWHILKNRVLRLNGEMIWTKNSPVGNLTYPTFVGSSGSAFVLNLELYF